MSSLLPWHSGVLPGRMLLVRRVCEIVDERVSGNVAKIADFDFSL